MRGLLTRIKSSEDISDVITINNLSIYGRTIANFTEVSQLFDSILEKGVDITSIANANNLFSDDMCEYRDEILRILDRILELL